MADTSPSQAPPRTPRPRSWLDVASGDGHLLVRVGGLGNMHAAVTLQDVVADWCRQGCTRLILDLEECAGLDSTFMGTLVCIASRLREENGGITLVNVSGHNRELLEMLGAAQFVTFGGRQDVPDLQFTRLAPVPGDARRRVELIREAHECLCRLSPENRQRFGSFLASLGAELDNGHPFPDTTDEDAD